ncbi:hypothetical protein mRhiFer1_008957 [Rhinolophus ferrumequinum]|uniref:Uncharacterized protein n=1 Tax=Rhinolophus ferrumequinum TaxID=59479 RepID=A0A7J7TEE7_RHIFE|nr:hypothetical protein mRhiFer1_008957 [Rhinolophus ferrumequinum]
MVSACVSEGFRNIPSRTAQQLLGVASELGRSTGHKVGRGGSDTAGGGVQWSWPQREAIFSTLLRSIVGESGSSEGAVQEGEENNRESILLQTNPRAKHSFLRMKNPLLHPVGAHKSRCFACGSSHFTFPVS